MLLFQTPAPNHHCATGCPNENSALALLWQQANALFVFGQPVCGECQVIMTGTENHNGAPYHATPTPKKRKQNQVHCLADSVAKNQPGVTRH